MNSNVDCSACTDLKNNAPEFVQNGVTKTVCASLKNNTGLNPRLTTLHDNCEDLDTATDCMIGMMEKEVDSYDICDWKDFMKNFINNLTQMMKAQNCSMCGLWDKVDCLTGSITDFSSICTYTPVSGYRYFYDWENINTDANPASPVTVNYNYMHSYVLLSPGSTVADLLNSVPAGGIYPNHTIDGYTYAGVPVYKFKGNMKTCNILGMASHAQITTDGRFTFEVVPIGAMDSDGNLEYYVAIRSRITEGEVVVGQTFSFFWNEEVLRKLDFNC